MPHAFYLPLVTIVLLMGCTTPRPAAPPTPAPVTPPARPAPPAPVALVPDWHDWARTPGVWTYQADARGSIARFGPAFGSAMLVLRCDRPAHMMYVSRTGGGTATLTVRTTSLTRMLNAMQTDNADESTIIAAIAAGDPLLDAMGFSRGRFLVEQAGMPPLVVPAWAEIERVTQDCRE